METVPLCDEDKAKILSGNVQRLLAVTTAWSRSFTRRVRSTASELGEDLHVDPGLVHFLDAHLTEVIEAVAK
jgi:hypothetical protein